MRPVWVVFYAALPCRDALLFTLFQVPTIVVADPSGADALTARRILWQGNPPEFPTPEELQAMSFRAFCARAREDIDEALSLTRTLLSDDLLVLAHSSGFFAEKTGGRGGDQFPTPRMRAEAVREYLKQ